MTIVVGYRDSKGDIWLGSDSLSTAGDFKFPDPAEKIFRIGDWAIGYAGIYFLKRQLLARSRMVGLMKEPGEVAGLMISLAKEYEIEPHKEPGEPLRYDFEMILARKGDLFEVSSSGNVREVTYNFTAIGVGCGYAFGAAHALRSFCPEWTGALLGRLTVEAAIAHDVHCGGSVITMRA